MRFLTKSISGLLLVFTSALAQGHPVNAEVVTFDGIATQSLQKSYDLLVGRIDSGLAKNKVSEAKVPYRPTLTGSINTEYVGNLTGNDNPQNQSPVVVGATILPGLQRFQTAMSLNANYTAFDFGARANQLRAAKHHLQGSIIQQKVDARDLKLAVLDAYVQALLSYKEGLFRQQQLSVYGKLYEWKYRLQQAGRIDRVELGEQAIVRSDAQKELDDLKVRLGEQLNQLSSYTHVPYNVEGVELADLKAEEPSLFLKTFPNPDLPDVKAYDLLIQEQQAQMKAIRAQRLPQISLFGSFVIYGSDKNNWTNGLGDLRARQVYFGIGSNIPIYDGGKVSVLVNEKKLLIDKLNAQK